MTIENFTPVSALIGGGLIGIAATLLLALNGRIAGVSGIVGRLFDPLPGDVAWRVMFLAGLMLGAGAYGIFQPVSIQVTNSILVLVVGGLLVGYGTQLGNGCTSGHGVCGIARLSPRSIVATLMFMASAAITVYLMRHVVGG
jgi:uncharacterized membrane protein YedE/YeeE